MNTNVDTLTFLVVIVTSRGKNIVVKPLPLVEFQIFANAARHDDFRTRSAQLVAH